MNRLRGQDGFSVIEVLGAMTVFAVVAAGMTAATVGTIKTNNTSKQASAATALVHDKIEQLRAPTVPAADLTAGMHSDNLNPMTPLGQQGGRFTRSWDVTRNSPKQGLAQVVVTVSWSGPEARTVRGVTFVCLSATCS